jgi:hypothetical protein
MANEKKRRFFWLEGVTRGEVEKSLRDTRPSMFRQQRPRRVLVLVTVFALALMALSIFIPDRKILTYGEGVLFILILVLYFKLRTAVRHVSDAPNELLDERQIKVRDACYTMAYRILAIVAVFYVGMFVAISEGGILTSYLAIGKASGLFYSFLLCAAALPAMVLAWTMPSELTDDAA